MGQLLLVTLMLGMSQLPSYTNFSQRGEGCGTWAEGRKGGPGQDLGCPLLGQEEGGIADVTPTRWMQVVANWQTEYLLDMDKIKHSFIHTYITNWFIYFKKVLKAAIEK